MSALVLGVAHGHLGICSGRRPPASTSYTPSPAARSSLNMRTPSQQLQVRQAGAPERRSRVQLQPRGKENTKQLPLAKRRGNAVVTDILTQTTRRQQPQRRVNSTASYSCRYFTPGLLRTVKNFAVRAVRERDTSAPKLFPRPLGARPHVTFQSSPSQQKQLNK